MVGKNAEFQCEFEQKIQIEVKMREKTKQHLEEKISQVYTKQFTQSNHKGQEKMQSFTPNSRKFDWRLKSTWKLENKNDSWKTKVGENFTISNKKIPSITSERREENAEFQSEFNGIRLKIQIEVKIKKTIFKREICKILQF